MGCGAGPQNRAHQDYAATALAGANRHLHRGGNKSRTIPFALLVERGSGGWNSLNSCRR